MGSSSSKGPDGIQNKVFKQLKEYNQLHLLEALKNCQTLEEKNLLVDQINGIDYELLSKLYKLGKNTDNNVIYKEEDISKIECQYPKETIEKEIDELSKIGMELIAQGKVGLLILAGGMGTRLGFNHPKGKYCINMPSGKTLFNYLSNRFLSSQMMCKKKLEGNKNIKFKECPLLVMGNPKTENEIKEYFKENNYFGIKEKDIYFFPQGDLCALDDTGRIILETPNKIFKSPDGNGGCLIALKKNGLIDECIKRGVEFINVISIDNPLCKLMDPLFVGITVSKGKNGKDQMAAKYLKKVDPEQKIGYFLNYKGKPMMIDYMEMPDKLKQSKLDNGDFTYNAGNILDYLISINFLKTVLYKNSNIQTLLSSFHHVRKKMKCYVYNEESKTFEEKEGFEHSKYEMFFNSIFEFSNKDGLLLMEIDPVEEFAPVKNDESKPTCTAKTSRIQMSNLCKKWYKENGGEIANDDEKKYLEISFLASYDGKNLFDDPNIPKKIDFKKMKAEEGIYIKNKELE